MGDRTVADPDSGGHTVPDALPSGVTIKLSDPPPVIAGWQLGRRIGQGGMGAVHLASKDGRQGALKLMHPQLDSAGDFRARFLRESEVLRAVQHANVVQLIDHGEDRGWLWLVMEYVTGGDLAGHLKRRGTLFEKEAVAIAARCCHGLAAIHAAGLIHRDLKPENIFLTPGAGGPPEPKIGDLGMARHAGGDDRMTLTGTACGTPAYMAPEQVRGTGDLDARVDVYAMGATLFTLLTGRKPFDGPTIYVLTHAVLTAPVPDMRRWNPQLTPGVVGLVEKAMAKDRDQRHRDIRELLLDLERLAEGKQPVSSAPAASPASMVFQEVVGSPAPRRQSRGGGLGGGAFSGIPWGAILRLGVPAALVIAALSAAPLLFEHKAGPAKPGPVPGDGGAHAPAIQRDAKGVLVRLPIVGQTAVLRWCPPGHFVMGSPADEAGRAGCETPHAVLLAHGFWMLDGEVSDAQWSALSEEGSGGEPQLPVVSLTLAQVQDWLGRLNHLHPGLDARLPTEAEWEYACRADDGGAIDGTLRTCTVPAVLAGWQDGTDGLFAAENAALLQPDNPALRPVPSAEAGINAWGLAGMSGNVAEWCLDRWDGESDYGPDAAADPVGRFGSFNAVRGGSWLHPPAMCRPAARAAADPAEAKPWLGFRFVVPGGQTAAWPPR